MPEVTCGMEPRVTPVCGPAIAAAARSVLPTRAGILKPMVKADLTIDHERIRRWAEERGGRPARVKRAGSAEQNGLLRIDFPDQPSHELREFISWEEFFRRFDQEHLALLFEEYSAGGFPSRLHRMISRQTAEQAGQPEAQRPSRAKGSRAIRVAASLQIPGNTPTANREEGTKRKKNVRTITQGKQHKKRIRKAA